MAVRGQVTRDADLISSSVDGERRARIDGAPDGTHTSGGGLTNELESNRSLHESRSISCAQAVEIRCHSHGKNLLSKVEGCGRGG